MKDQYFGDINDYRKYGVLRCLAEAGPFSLGLCWMLTPSDGSTDGRFTQYLENPTEWQHFDPPLFVALNRALRSRESRAVALAERYDLLPGAVFFGSEVPAGRVARMRFMAACLKYVAACDLLFFDPDNGIEVSSVPYGSKAAPKYVYWRELGAAFQEGHSLLVYQHYPRQERAAFHQKISGQFRERLRPAGLWVLATSTVAYLLAVQPSHLHRARASLQALHDCWGREIRPIALLDA
jgi:hypothetical protein